MIVAGYTVPPEVEARLVELREACAKKCLNLAAEMREMAEDAGNDSLEGWCYARAGALREAAEAIRELPLVPPAMVPFPCRTWPWRHEDDNDPEALTARLTRPNPAASPAGREG